MESGRANVPNDVREIEPINLRVTCRRRFQPTTREVSSWQPDQSGSTRFYQPNPGAPFNRHLPISPERGENNHSLSRRSRADHFHQSNNPIRRSIHAVPPHCPLIRERTERSIPIFINFHILCRAIDIRFSSYFHASVAKQIGQRVGCDEANFY